MTMPPLPDFEGQVPEEEDERRRKRAGWWWWGERGIFLLVLALALAILGLIGLDRSADDAEVVGSPPTVPSQPVVTPSAPFPSTTPSADASAEPSDTDGGVSDGQQTVTAAPPAVQQPVPSVGGDRSGKKSTGKNKGKNKGKGKGKHKPKKPKKPKPPKCKRPGKKPCTPKPTPTPTPTATPTPTPTPTGPLPTVGPKRCVADVTCVTRSLVIGKVVSGGMAMLPQPVVAPASSIAWTARPSENGLSSRATYGASLNPMLVTDMRGSRFGWSLTMSARTADGVHVLVDPWCHSVAAMSAPGLQSGGAGQMTDRAASVCVKNEEVGWSYSTSGVYMIGGDISVVDVDENDLTEPVVVTMTLA